MPAVIPLIVAGISAAGSAYAAHKSGEALKLDPRTKEMQDQALIIQNQRMLQQNPLFEQLTQGAMSRQPRSAMPQNYQLANQGGQYPTQQNPMTRFNPSQLQNGGAMGQAMQALAGRVRDPREQLGRAGR